MTKGLRAHGANRVGIALGRFGDRIGVARRVVVITIGWAVLALGVILFALPLASLIILLGLAILSMEYRWAKTTLRWVGNLKGRAHSLASRVGRAVARLARGAVGTLSTVPTRLSSGPPRVAVHPSR